jgi:hypothetical protein
LKTTIFILILSFLGFASFAQTDTTRDSNIAPPVDTAVEIKPAEMPKPATRRIAVDFIRRKRIHDSLLAASGTVEKDSLAFVVTDTNRKIISADTIKTHAKPIIIKRPIDPFYLKLLDNPFLRSKAKPIFLVVNERKRTTKDEAFYLLSGLLLFLAFIKVAFSRYFKNLFRLFFQPSFRQKQTREQLQQGKFPSLLLNLFFILSTAAYISFLLKDYQVVQTNFWYLLLYSSLALIILYIGKYIFLSFAGWVFNVKEVISAYIFVIYLINKIMGIVLIPFILIIAFAQDGIKSISITVSILLISLLFLYRYLVSYNPVIREVKVSALHFFFYVLAFEITPLLLIYKTLMLYLDKSL